MDLDNITLSEENQRKKILYDIIYMWNLKKMVRMNSFTKQTHRYRKQTYGYQRDVEG